MTYLDDKSRKYICHKKISSMARIDTKRVRFFHNQLEIKALVTYGIIIANFFDRTLENQN